MCTLAIYHRVSERFPLVVAANRDEFLARPTTAPARWANDPLVIAGRDEKEGGTWLGVRLQDEDRAGPLIVGVLNRRPGPNSRGSKTGPRSRGTLCRQLLDYPSVESALGALQDLDASDYGGFNLLLADAGRAVVIDNAGSADLPGRSPSVDALRPDRARVHELFKGLSVLTNLDVNDVRCPRLATASMAFRAFSATVEHAPTAEDLVPGLAGILGNHELADTIQRDTIQNGTARKDTARKDSVEAGAHQTNPPQESIELAATPRPEANEGATRDPYAQVCVHAGDYGTRSASVLVASKDGEIAYFHASGPPCVTEFSRIHPED